MRGGSSHATEGLLQSLRSPQICLPALSQSCVYQNQTYGKAKGEACRVADIIVHPIHFMKVTKIVPSKQSTYKKKRYQPTPIPNMMNPGHHITTFVVLYTINASLTIFAIMHVILRRTR
jgi:hypothetical protein